MDAVILDPEIAQNVGIAPDFRFTPETLPLFRASRAAAAPELTDSIERSDHVVRADPQVVVRVHRPKRATGPLPCVYAIHGGGFVIGTYAMDDLRFDRWCNAFDCVGVSVEYRLAPETAYPGPLDDCYDGLAWVFEHAAELGIDPSRVGVSGISAGAGLAAGLALRVRDEGKHTLAFQLLECPMLDDRRITSSSQLDGLPVWSREANEYGWRAYLGDLYGTDRVPSHAAPARETNLHGLPPTFIVVGTADGFRDEDIDYAARLNQHGVPTELHVLPGAPHGVQMWPQSGVAKRWQQLTDDWLGRQLA